MKVEDTLIIKQTNDFCEYMQNKGFEVKKAYICKGTIDNSIRNKMNKVKLPFQSIWYNKILENIKQENIVIYEPLITADFVKWLRKSNPSKRIDFIYLNIVKWSIHPNDIKPYCDVFTWDRLDAEKYNMNMFKGTYWYKPMPPSEKEFDLIFVGRDKGRLDELIELENKIQSYGLKTYFHIVGDKGFNRNPQEYKYKRVISYEKLLEYTVKSRAVLEMVQDGQVGHTLRTMESLYYGIKLITNNKHIAEYDFYNTNNVFILGKDRMEDIKDFLSTPFEPINEEILRSYSFEMMISNL